MSVYVTGDVIRLYLALQKYDRISGLIDSLQKIQNNDGGWGVCNGDQISKVRSTSWVLSVLLTCMNNNITSTFPSKEVVTKGITWLYVAQNDNRDDSGWGNLPDTMPSNVSATAFALDALIDSVKYCQSHKCNLIPIRPDAIKRGLNKLVNMRGDNMWRGVREEFAIQIDGSVIGRHVIGGAGTTSVAQVLLKAHDAGLLEWPNELIPQIITNLVDRCVDYQQLKGNWLFPADDGGPPLTWNSAYAIDAFNLFEKFYVDKIADQWIERQIYVAITKNTRIWQRVSIALLFAIVGIIVAPYLSVLGNIPTWFANLPVLYQGVILMIVTLAFERLYDFTTRTFLKSENPILRIRKPTV